MERWRYEQDKESENFPTDNAVAQFRTEKDKANEHLLTGAYIDVRDLNKAEFNAVFRRVIN